MRPTLAQRSCTARRSRRDAQAAGCLARILPATRQRGGGQVSRLYCLRLQGTIKLGREAEHTARCASEHVSYRPSKQPGLAALERQRDAGVAKAIDGCRTEPDGHCQHGLPSWLLRLGFI